MAYLHGVYGEQIPTQDSLPPSGVATLPVYVGTAPGAGVSGITVINKPVLVNSFDDAKGIVGYSDDWETYTLCEAVYAHFRNKLGPIGPIILINVLDPDIHTEENPATETDIVGGIDADGKRTGLACVDLVYQAYNMIPTIIAAPGWSHKSAVEAALLEKCQKINGHWDAICVTDIDSSAAKTIGAAKTWKQTNAYTSKLEKACWPKVKSGSNTFWLSTMAVVRMQQTDYANDSIPYESPSNKPIDITGAILSDGSTVDFDEIQANDLNSEGITTVTYRSGTWVLWGPHNGNYKSGAEIDPRDKFDCNIRMMAYLTNSFQQNYMSDVDQPLNRSKVDTILNDAQVWLNGLVGDGKMLYGKIDFNESSNPISSIIEGDFVFDIQTTTTPPGKSLTFRVQYTTQGIEMLYGGSEG
ncbi:phage tail sheath protein FI [Anaerobacterium chartisolvens]|uniref:Phage tail sheath protein FI n=1 Tax=Anaerobacterium chartisolvens TaxID=1297424 RepID=A0A369BHJ8_9FIRM|nr:phage tail sheath protein [Anaerobacterium chartisolvens]RCX20881.1 phage tail sheath protein FI [Anaerobacterium chartisolvens]